MATNFVWLFVKVIVQITYYGIMAHYEPIRRARSVS